MEKEYREMTEVSHEDYLGFIENNASVFIEDVEIKLGKLFSIKSFGPPEDYRIEDSTVWSFPNRGNWATHKSNYRGNWSPYIPRNLILKYTKEGDWVLDQMMGSGTTLIEAK